MYVELIKNFSLADSSELMAVRLILASWAQKRLIPYFLDMMYVEFMTNFFSPIRASWWLLDSFRHPEPKTFDPYFLDMMYVDFMKNFLLPDSSELMAVRLISASWAQKRLIPWCNVHRSCASNFFTVMQGLQNRRALGHGAPPPLFWKQENVPFLHRMCALFDTQ